MKITETACVSDELCRLLKKKKKTNREFRRFAYIACIRDRIAFLSMLTVRAVVLEYKKA